MGINESNGTDFGMWTSKGLTIAQQYDFVDACICLKKARALLDSVASPILLQYLDSSIKFIEEEGNIEDDAIRTKRKKEYAEKIKEALQ